MSQNMTLLEKRSASPNASDDEPPTKRARTGAGTGLLASSGLTSDVLLPEEMIMRFQEAAKEQLKPRFHVALTRFLDRVQNQPASDPVLQGRLNAAVERFRERESEMSGKPAEELIPPQGSATARFGVMMHYPTFRKSNSTFFDNGNACVRMLMKKGFTEANSLGFDLDWRQEHSMSGKDKHKTGQCPRQVYSGPIMQLHDAVSKRVCQIATMPLLVLVGKCVAQTYRAWIKDQQKAVVKVELANGEEVEYVLCFDVQNQLQRISVEIPHPQYFKIKRGDREKANAADCALNLFFAMTGQTSQVNVDYISWSDHREVEQNGTSEDSCNGVLLLSKLLSAEKRSGCVIPFDSFDKGLILWAQERYPYLDLEDRVKSGLSIARAINDELGAAGALTRCGRDRSSLPVMPEADREDAGGQQGDLLLRYDPSQDSGHHAMVRKKFWDGARVSITQARWSQIELPVPRGVRDLVLIRIAMGNLPFIYGERLFIFFDSIGISIRRDVNLQSSGELVWRKTYQCLVRLRDGALIVEQAKSELKRLALRRAAGFQKDFLL